ncbi:GNAT family N-acetyltransferase [Alkalibacillus salilacus]|uniref:RimJ/RimL family protein N-acetyltransferase n=1 Tax=Alkalibacillus salilacus TaxID=284582 RepID=A0ABT9VGA9_9BACI|nr:GNAT family N-acetyltransferase [Alkalibacillus salilacus]MDQ0159986.1 RimJ/RimL family protein N-acetyltransferase [Alkalibacillus salilacus]
MKIREVETFDADKLANLIQRVDESAQYMLWEAGERDIQPENQRSMIESFKKASNSAIFVAESDYELVGYLIAIGGNAKRNQHSAYLVIGVLEGFRGMGVGTKLFEKLETWAALKNVSRLELSVVTKNESGLSLYKKAGFEIEGTKRNALFINNEMVDEYYMAKLL